MDTGVRHFRDWLASPALPTSFHGIPLCASLRHCYGSGTGITFVDATALAVCHNRRIAQHCVFAGLAKRGKTSLGWFFGFKLYLLVNDKGSYWR
jgi:hypothetical protein